MDINEKFNLIKRNTFEIIEEGELKELLKQKKTPVVYIGTAITGKPHIAYYFWILKLADFLKAGFKVKLLLADLHGALDNTPWNILDKRYDYYKKIIPLMFESIGAKINNFEFVKGSNYQLKADYMLDVLRMSIFTSANDCKKAASEVVKFDENPKLSGFIYPIMQTLDEQYLEVDVQLGGTDQRKIMVLARESLPKLDYKKRVEIMFPLIPGLIGKKMSASDEKSKVDILDDEETVNKKISEAYCIAGEVKDNGVLAFLKHVIMIIKSDNKEKFVVERDPKYGKNLVYSNYEDIEKDFVNKNLHPLDLKRAVAKEINLLLKPIRKKRDILKKLADKAYS